MYGISLLELWTKKYGEEIAKQKIKEAGEKISKANTGKHPKQPIRDENYVHHMKGKSLYSIWLEKYGEEEANIRKQNYSKKISELTKGSKNPMYGRSPSHSAGLGYSGRYNSWYFRSILELSYMIKIIERFKLSWNKGELKKYRCFYEDEKGTSSSYLPDFVIENKYVVEIKPKFALQHNKYKHQKAKEYFESLGFKFKITRCSLLSSEKLINLYKNKLIIFNKRSEDKFLKYFKLKED